MKIKNETFFLTLRNYLQIYLLKKQMNTQTILLNMEIEFLMHLNTIIRR